MSIKHLKSKEDKYFLKTYNRLDIDIIKGKGCYLITSNGDKILDMFSGLGVNLLGYKNKRINQAIKEQLKKYSHISNYFYQEPQIKFAKSLLEKTGFEKLFLCNTGTEAVEASIKLIRKKFHNTDKKEIIAFKGGFHGRTMGSLSLTQNEKYREYFYPLLPDVKSLSFNSIQDLESNISEKTSAIYIECIQGEGGINIAANAFIEKINILKEKFNFLIIADEIQSGGGRTGKFFSFNYYNFKPDIVVMAKGIGGGLPLGIMLVNKSLSDIFTPGDHGSTFGGNPAACKAGIIILKELNKKLMIKAKEKGDYLIKRLTDLKNEYPNQIANIRGIGLMIGIEMTEPCNDYVSQLMRYRVLVNCTNKNVIRLLPPLIIKYKDIDFFLKQFSKLLEYKQKNPELPG